MVLNFEQFRSGTLTDGWKSFGAHIAEENGVKGIEFVLWCPGVREIDIAGSFNDWRTDRYRMTHIEGGVWRGFVPAEVPGAPGMAVPGASYKYFIRTFDKGDFFKADPYAFYAEKRPETASRIFDLDAYEWHDGAWMEDRRRNGHRNRPLNIYEVHAGSWRRHPNGDYYSWRDLANELVPYAKDMNYTHIELLPVMEHPFDGSWGYQVTGYFAPTSRFGSPADLMYFIDRCHEEGIGVILDWVPGHFCRDAHGLYRFNGEPLYENVDHPQWGTSKFDFGRGEVRSFLVSNALYWVEKYHADGIRVDGVTSMLYLNFGVEDPDLKRYNQNGGEEDLEAINFIRGLNWTLGTLHPDVMTIAEESTAWPLVTAPINVGGLGFHYKWDMGWMHDTLDYMKADFPYRPGCHNFLTFSIMYAFSENFICALSHDEVVHGKASIIGRMPGDNWRKFAGVRALALYQFTHPGGKLNFMGSEIAQFIEWREYEGLQWFLLGYDTHRGVQSFIRDLSGVYKNEPALWERQHSSDGFEWLDADNRDHCTVLYVRHGNWPDDKLTVLINFVPEVTDGFRIGVAEPGEYIEILNSDDWKYGGSGRTNPGRIRADRIPSQGKPYSVVVKTPPVGGLILKKVK